MSEKDKKFYVDYRFIVKVCDKAEADRKILNFLPNSTDDIWYTIKDILEAEA